MPEITYTVEVKTGYKGTNADIEIFLMGTKGNWKEFQLMDNPGLDDLEPNQISTFTFYDDIDIGTVTDIALRPRGPGLYHDNWKMDGIKINSNGKDSMESTFGERKRLFVGDAEPIILRANEFPSINLINKTENIKVRSYVIAENNFGGNATKEHKETSEIIESESLTISTEDSLALKQSYEMQTGVKVEGIVDVSSTFSSEIAATFKQVVTNQKEKIIKRSNSFSYEGKDNHCNFFIYTDYEIRVIGTYDIGKSKKGKVEEPIEKHRTVVIRSFKAVDQKLDGSNESFEEMWVMAGESLENIPKTPTLADLEK